LRRYHRFSWKEANFRICSTHIDTVKEEIKKQRKILEEYIERHPAFGSSFTPVPLYPRAPDIARRMARASRKTGVGPMAAVAGTVAQLAAEAALRQGDRDVVVENGGDIYLASDKEVIVGLFAGSSSLSDKLAVSVIPAVMPLSICSSSSHMGHSVSLGRCDLACVAAKDAALADAAATCACNSVKTFSDIEHCLEQIMDISGIHGILIVKEEKIGLAGGFPPLVRNKDTLFPGKITFSKE
jgi:ApbE superfamily uncharacterized protein (UPF0280 family)